MAKKVVASFKDGIAKYTKVIKMVKSKTGAYQFKEEVVPSEKVKEVLEEK